MLLEGHGGDIFSIEFHPDGQYLASTGFDRQICKTIITKKKRKTRNYY